MTNNNKKDATRKIELSREQMCALARLVTEYKIDPLGEYMDTIYASGNNPTDEESERFWFWRDIHKALHDACDGTAEQDAVWYYERRELGADEDNA